MAKLKYQLIGTGKKVLFLHGWGRSGDDFSFLHSLPFGYQALIPDLPGFGQSSENPLVIKASEYADAVQNLMEEIDFKPDLIVGHSFGGKIGYLIAKKHSNCKLLLTAPSLVRPHFSMKKFLKIRLYKIKKRLGIESKNAGSNDYQRATPQMKRVLIEAVNTYFNRDLKNYQGEMVLFWGNKDHETPLYMARYIKKAVKNSRLIIVDGGHFAFQQHKYHLIRTIEQLLCQ